MERFEIHSLIVCLAMYNRDDKRSIYQLASLYIKDKLLYFLFIYLTTMKNNWPFIFITIYNLHWRLLKTAAGIFLERD